MKIKTLLSGSCTLLLLLALRAYSADTDTTQRWFSFTPSKSLDSNSPSNVGKLTLNAPAGKHGFLKTENNHFVFEDGTSARLWGTNLCFSACFPSKTNAEMMADRLAFFGFNSVRLHHMDFAYEPIGIFKDTRPSTKNPQRKNTRTLSRRQLDRLDYLIYQLKMRGIYVNINLLVSRHFTFADGVTDATKLDFAAKPASFFDPRLIELQKKYAEDLLTHTNKYTGLRYCDDPAVAIVEMTNENSLFDYWRWGRLDKNPFKKGVLPDFYLNTLDALWKRWAPPDSPPRSSATPESLTAFYTHVEKQYFDDMKNFLKNELGVKCLITGIGGNPDVQDERAQVNCDFIDSHAYWDHPSFPQSGWDPKRFKIHGRSLLADPKLGFVKHFSEPAEYADKPRTMTEWSHCYPNQYAYETPVLVAASARQNQWAGLFKFAFSHDDPNSAKWTQIDSYFDIIANPQQLLLMSVASRVFQKSGELKMSVNDGVFLLNSDTVEGAAGAIQGKSISSDHMKISSDQNGAVYLVTTDQKPIRDSQSLVLMMISEVKNEQSGWNKEGWFDWGHAPTRLLEINAELSIVSNGRLKAYELDERGSVGKELETKFADGRTIISIKDAKTPWFFLTYGSKTG